MTSLKQYQDHHQAWIDRHDVDKAFKDWEKTKHAPRIFPDDYVWCLEEMKDFAIFFAERVKGADITLKHKPHGSNPEI